MKIATFLTGLILAFVTCWATLAVNLYFYLFPLIAIVLVVQVLSMPGLFCLATPTKPMSERLATYLMASALNWNILYWSLILVVNWRTIAIGFFMGKGALSDESIQLANHMFSFKPEPKKQ